MSLRVPLRSEWRREALRTNLWLVPVLEVLAAVALYFATHAIDRAAFRGSVTLPSWLLFGTADASRQILTALAAAVITVVGVVFSITIVTLTLASTQFGPRIMRNFIRDRGTQVTLGTFVATFVYTVLALISIGPAGAGRQFVPHLSITVAVALVTISLGVLIYFINHIATSIQLPHVIASIAEDLSRAIDTDSDRGEAPLEAGPSVGELRRRLEKSGVTVAAPASGYLQFIRHRTLVRIAGEEDAVIQLLHRPGHFVVRGRPLARVWPAEAADSVERELRRAHITGPSRTLAQDLALSVDQLVEIALRALSPAVNDTFTALTCIDWLGEGLCKATAQWRPADVQRDREGHARVIAAPMTYTRLVERAFEKIRQAGRGMPAVMIRQLDALRRIMDHTTNAEQRELLLAQAAMIEQSSIESVPAAPDRADVSRAFARVLEAAGRTGGC